MTQQILKTTITIAREAGALLLEGLYDRKEIQKKSSTFDLVTQYDEAAEALILARLQEHFPDHQVKSEESGVSGDDGEMLWYIDPLDGTNNFAHGIPVFCVSMALYQNDAPLLGVVYDPTRDECFSVRRGGGAWLDSPRGRERLQVSSAATLAESIVATGFPYDRRTNPNNNIAQVTGFVTEVQGIRRAGAAALDIAYVAAGRNDGYWEFNLKSWDLAAAVLMVTEAGGIVTAIDGNPIDITLPRIELLVSNPTVHPLMLDVLAETMG